MMFDSCICIDDIDDRYECFTAIDRRARKQYRCGECRALIEVGDLYECATGLLYRRWDTHRTCLTCARIGESLFSCGRVFGAMWEYIHETICAEGESDECVCPPRSE